MTRTGGNPLGMASRRSGDYDSMNLGAICRRWDTRASNWDADLQRTNCHLHADDGYRRFLETALRITAARADFCRSRLLVDLGCGTGLVLEQLIARFAAGLGIDISEEMLQIARQKQLPRTDFRRLNVFQFAADVSGAGAVFSRGILLSHYGPRWASALLRQIHKVLVPNGGFALLDFLNAAARTLHPGNPLHKMYFYPEQIAALGRRAGFQRCRILGAPQRRVLLVILERKS